LTSLGSTSLRPGRSITSLNVKTFGASFNLDAKVVGKVHPLPKGERRGAIISLAYGASAAFTPVPLLLVR
jgi:hypothetical protein